MKTLLIAVLVTLVLTAGCGGNSGGEKAKAKPTLASLENSEPELRAEGEQISEAIGDLVDRHWEDDPCGTADQIQEKVYRLDEIQEKLTAKLGRAETVRLRCALDDAYAALRTVAYYC
jgi:hypothetical protein